MISIHFPLIFVFIPILLALWYFLDFKNLGHSAPNNFLKKYTKNPSEKKWIFLMRFFAIFFILAIFSNINYTHTISKKIPEPHTSIIVLDISRSMLAEDMSPNRMSVAKNAIKNFIETRNQDQFTLIIFAGKAFTTISNSDDKDGILVFIENISPNYILQEKPGLSGTNI